VKIVLALDIGTGSTKALAVDEQGHIHYSARAVYDTYYPQAGYAEQNPEEIASAVWNLLQGCPTNVKENISAISFSSAMHSVMAVDQKGNPLSPLIIWSDLRSRDQSVALQQSGLSKSLHASTGTPVHPMSPLCKIIWFREKQPELFTSACKFIGIKEYIWFKLFGEFEIDQGLSSATGLMTTGTLHWNQQALSVAGIQPSRLSAIVSPYHSRILNPQQHPWAAEFSKPVPVVIGSSDGCLANLGSKAMDSNSLSLTLGTSGAVRRTIPKQSHAGAAKGLFCYHLDEDNLIEGGASNNGAALVNWYIDHFLEGKLDVTEFIKKASQVSIGSERLIFLPYINGERSPFYNPDASGVFLGIRHHHRQQHFMRAVLEGIGYALLLIVEQIEISSGPYDKVMASGGFTQSDEWVNVMADIFGKPVTVQTHEDASARGAAMMGFSALQVSCNFNTDHAVTFQPDESRHREYQKAYAVFKRMAYQFNTAF
jgi:gluconokinase